MFDFIKLFFKTVFAMFFGKSEEHTTPKHNALDELLKAIEISNPEIYIESHGQTIRLDSPDRKIIVLIYELPKP